MDIHEVKEKSISILADENGNLAFFSYTRNPDWTPEMSLPNTRPPEEQVAPVLPTTNPIELPFPYDIAQIVNALKETLSRWWQGEPIPQKTDITQWYYNKKSFVAASKGKRLIYVEINCFKDPYSRLLESSITLLLPRKMERGHMYAGIAETQLPADATFEDLAQAILDMLNYCYNDSEYFTKRARKHHFTFNL